MKKTIILFIGLLLLNYSDTGYCSGASKETARRNNSSAPGSVIVVQSSPDLFNIAEQWASEFTRLNPGVNVKVNLVKGSGSYDIINEPGTLFFLGNDYYEKVKNESYWKMVVGRDAIVPVINTKNPFLKEITGQGISSDELAGLFKSPENRKWSTLLQNGGDVPVHYYYVNDESIGINVAEFINGNPSSPEGISVQSSEEMISSIQKDPLALGFCRIKDIIDFRNQNIVDNIQLLPIDKNGNGRLDQFEKIYGNLNTFMRGVWIGKYPSALCRNIYSVSSSKPSDKNEIAFLKWVLTDGQKYLNQNGYFDLVYSERQAKTDLLTDKKIYLSSSDETSPLQKALITLIVIVAGIFIIVIGYRFFRSRQVTMTEGKAANTSIFDEKSILVPKGLYFDKSHTWAFMEKNGIVSIGVDDFLQHITGSVTRIKMKNRGEKITKGEPILSLIQNGKQLTIYSPVSGIITSRNETLIKDSSVVNSSPYSDGWIYRVEPSNWIREAQFMIIGDKFTAWLHNEFARLKDFLASSSMITTSDYSHVVLQDGGVLKDHILEDFGPEVWEDFQTKFIDSSK